MGHKPVDSSKTSCFNENVYLALNAKKPLYSKPLYHHTVIIILQREG